eukprot:354545-Chlamydomonas_euryale.AAC.5
MRGLGGSAAASLLRLRHNPLTDLVTPSRCLASSAHGLAETGVRAMTARAKRRMLLPHSKTPIGRARAAVAAVSQPP